MQIDSTPKVRDGPKPGTVIIQDHGAYLRMRCNKLPLMERAYTYHIKYMSDNLIFKIFKKNSVLAGGRCPPDPPNFGWGGKAPPDPP